MIGRKRTKSLYKRLRSLSPPPRERPNEVGAPRESKIEEEEIRSCKEDCGLVNEGDLKGLESTGPLVRKRSKSNNFEKNGRWLNMEQAIEEQCDIERISILPDEVLCYVFSFLSYKEILDVIPQVSSRWRKVSWDPKLQQDVAAAQVLKRLIVFRPSFLRENLQYKTRFVCAFPWSEALNENIVQIQRKKEEIEGDPNSPANRRISWLDHRSLINSRSANTTHGSAHAFKNASDSKFSRGVFLGHPSGNISYKGLDPFQGKMDRLEKTYINAHSSSIRCMTRWGNRLVSGCSGGKIRLWDVSVIGELTPVGMIDLNNTTTVNNEKQIQNIPNNLPPIQLKQVEVWCLEIWIDRVVVGISDGKIRVFDKNGFLSNGRYLFDLIGHKYTGVTALHSAKEFLYSGGGDRIIIQWNKHGNCANILKGHSGWICSIQSLRNYIFSSSSDGTIRMWSGNKCIRIMEEHNAQVRTICTDSYFLYSYDSNSRFAIWTANGRLVQKLTQSHPRSESVNNSSDIQLLRGIMSFCMDNLLLCMRADGTFSGWSVWGSSNEAPHEKV